MKSFLWQLVFVAGFILVVGIVIWNRSDSTRQNRTPAGHLSAPADSKQGSGSADENFWAAIDRHFAGDQSCLECHHSEFEAHQRSGHSHTAFRMEQTELARILHGTTYRDPSRPRIVRFTLQDGEFIATTQESGQTERQKVDWLLGSGTHAQTPVSVLADQNLGIEHGWSYFRTSNQLAPTPGQSLNDSQSPQGATCAGRVMSGTEVSNCLGCHMTFGPAPGQPLNSARWQANISCERCHGPRKAHVHAARQGRAGDVKPLVNLKQASVEMDLCAQCHRDEKQVDPRQPERDLVRFQPYRLKLSACYQSAPSVMSCISCHDPHDKTSHDAGMYIQKCASCHTQPEQTHCRRNPTLDQAGQNCITCHMPAREWVEGVKFVDHWIRVVPPNTASLPSGE